MSAFTELELRFLSSARLLARIATLDAAGNLHVTPVGWSLNHAEGTIDVGGRDLTATKKFRDVASTKRAAIVIDEVLPPWRPRGVEVRGIAEAVDGPTPVIRIHPDRVISWGALDDPPSTGGPTGAGH